MKGFKALVVLSFVAACFVYGSEARCYREDKFEKVKVGLYYEALCGGCKHLMSEVIYPTYKAISSIMELELVPFGNGYIKGSEAVCQHGERECFLNTLQSCALHYYNFDHALEFIHCMEEEESSVSDDLISKCAKNNNVDLKKMLVCAMSDEGRKFLDVMYRKTLVLKPAHEYVPWLTVNGQHTDEGSDLLKIVCDLYEGPKPQECEKSAY